MSKKEDMPNSTISTTLESSVVNERDQLRNNYISTQVSNLILDLQVSQPFNIVAQLVSNDGNYLEVRWIM